MITRFCNFKQFLFISTTRLRLNKNYFYFHRAFTNNFSFLNCTYNNISLLTTSITTQCTLSASGVQPLYLCNNHYLIKTGIDRNVHQLMLDESLAVELILLVKFCENNKYYCYQTKHIQIVSDNSFNL